MDSLKFCCSWKGSLQGAKFNVKIGGLQLEGCSFDGTRLSENQRDSPSISAIPPCMVAWIKVYFSTIILFSVFYQILAGVATVEMIRKWFPIHSTVDAFVSRISIYLVTNIFKLLLRKDSKTFSLM